MYSCVHSRLLKTPCTDEEELLHQEKRKQKEKEVSEAFMHYLSGTGPFEDWESNWEHFQRVHVSFQNLS